MFNETDIPFLIESTVQIDGALPHECVLTFLTDPSSKLVRGMLFKDIVLVPPKKKKIDAAPFYVKA